MKAARRNWPRLLDRTGAWTSVVDATPAVRPLETTPRPQHGVSRHLQHRQLVENRGSATLRAVEDYTNKYKGEQVELALFGGEYQEGVLTAYCSIEDVPHVELNGHILVPLQNVASLHCSSRCDAPEPDWPPRGLEELDRDDRPDDEDDES
jgi:hypothetical protein